MQFLDERFWLAVCFIIFILLIYKVAKKTVLNILDSKIEEITSNLEEAKNIKKEAQDTLNQTLKEITGLKNLKKEILEAAILDSAKATALLEKKMQQELMLKKAQMEEFIEDRKNKAYKNLTEEFNANAIKLVTEYFEATNNHGLTDLEIARLIKK